MKLTLRELMDIASEHLNLPLEEIELDYSFLMTNEGDCDLQRRIKTSKEEIQEAVELLLKSNDYYQAIAFYRTQTKVPMMEAKDYVDALQTRIQQKLTPV